MEFLSSVLEFILHLDKHLADLTSQYGVWTYVLMGLVIFCETGLVVAPFLPGDSLLFAAGTIAATGSLNPHLLFVIMSIAGILGNSVNYSIGHFAGPRVFAENRRFLKKQYLDKAHDFYTKHGGKAVILGRFLPIIRTFVPFVAGIGAMTYARYTLFNVIGSLLWVGLFVYAGYFFGNLSFVKNNFSVVIIAIIVISSIPALWEAIRHRRQTKSSS